MQAIKFLAIGVLLGISAGYLLWHKSQPIASLLSDAPDTETQCAEQIVVVQAENTRLKTQVESCAVNPNKLERENSLSNIDWAPNSPNESHAVSATVLEARKAAETTIFDASDAQEAASSLSKAEITDFAMELAKAKQADPQLASLIRGKFKGELLFLHDSRRWTVELTFNQDENARVVKGLYLVTMYDEKGEETSRGRSDGNQGLQFRQATGGSDALLVTDGSPSGFFQFFPNRNPNLLVGNYYNSEDSGGFKRTALVQLTRE